MREYLWSRSMPPCERCGWPHYLRRDYPAKPARRFPKRAYEPPRSTILCANCYFIAERITEEVGP